MIYGFLCCMVGREHEERGTGDTRSLQSRLHAVKQTILVTTSQKPSKIALDEPRPPKAERESSMSTQASKLSKPQRDESSESAKMGL